MTSTNYWTAVVRWIKQGNNPLAWAAWQLAPFLLAFNNIRLQQEGVNLSEQFQYLRKDKAEAVEIEISWKFTDAYHQLRTPTCTKESWESRATQ